ncbi:MAG: hypothetical protein COX46_02505, partial [bacterium (Candidatus Ratteibacteria) CG23_combo_of_CG06-09_8_20_14_all_48_7]
MTGWFCGGIYIVLVILSLVSWALIFQKMALLRRVRRADALFRRLSGKEVSGSDTTFLSLSSFYLVYKTEREF